MAEISTEDAVETLHQMFGSYDKSALAAVLEANGGHVERTVEHLLSNPPDGLNDGGSGGSNAGGADGGAASATTDHDAALALQLSREWGDDPTSAPPPPTRPKGIPTPYGRPTGSGGGGGGGGVFSAGAGNVQASRDSFDGAATSSMPASSGVGGGSSDRRGRRVALPEMFLRTPGWRSGGEEVSGDPQVAADARLAMMLQNQSFQRELQSHPELAYLGRRSTGPGPSRERLFGGSGENAGPSIREQLTSMGNDARRKMEELAVRWKMKDPGRADDTTEYSSVPLMSSQADDLDDQAEVVHFAQDSATRRSHAAAPGGAFRSDSGIEEPLADPRRSKKDR